MAVGPVILYFIFGSLLTYFGFVVTMNALQHPKIKLADLAIYAATIPTTVCLLLDHFVSAT